MNNPHNITVGQKLWLVPNGRRGEPQYVSVTKVGRKWAEIEWYYHESRVALSGLYVDGGDYTSPAQCYLSRDAWEQQQAVNEAWAVFRRQVEGRYGEMPLSLEQIHQASSILGFDLK